MLKNPVTDSITDHTLQYRNPVKEKLTRQNAEGLPILNIGRDQILARLWQLASLDHEATRGSITGQIKAVSMIIAIEGLIPDRRVSSNQARATQASPITPPVDKFPAASPTAAPPQPKPLTDSPSLKRNQDQTGFNPFIHSNRTSQAPDPRDAYSVSLNPAGPLNLSIQKNAFTSLNP